MSGTSETKNKTWYRANGYLTKVWDKGCKVHGPLKSYAKCWARACFLERHPIVFKGFSRVHDLTELYI